MSIIQAAILGIVEGLTEFLPVSSTGHLMIASRLLGLGDSAFVKSFDIAIQFGAILAVLVLYGSQAFRDRKLFTRVSAAFIPTAIVGFALYKLIKGYFLESVPLVAWSLLLGGIAILVFEYWVERRAQKPVGDIDSMSIRQAVVVGAFQSLAVIPGVSRSAATIIGGMISGISREAIVRFSFLLAVPTMLAAAGYDLMKSAASFGTDELASLAVGFAVSFGVALLAVRWFTAFVSKHTFRPFAWYRIALGLLLLGFGVR